MKHVKAHSAFLKKRWAENREEMLVIAKQGGQVKGKSRLPLSKDARMRISEALKQRGCHPPWWLSPCAQKGYKRERIFGKEVADKIRQATTVANQNRVVSDKTRLKMSLQKLGIKRWPPSKETREKIRKGNLGLKRTSETRVKLSARMKRQWDTDEFVQKQMFARRVKPNKKEVSLLALLDKLLPNEYKYVGSGEVVLGGKCPDFINVNGQKKLIELYGDYWHCGEDPEQRIAHFQTYGYQTLVIWERELGDIPMLAHKMLEFTKEV